MNYNNLNVNRNNYNKEVEVSVRCVRDLKVNTGGCPFKTPFFLFIMSQ